jgi:hypothetical protein
MTSHERRCPKLNVRESHYLGAQYLYCPSCQRIVKAQGEGTVNTDEPRKEGGDGCLPEPK